MSTRLNWRTLLGEFVVIVVGVLVALWVDEVKEARADARLEVEYLQSFLTDLDARSGTVRLDRRLDAQTGSC